MSVQKALLFIATLRRDDALRSALREQEDETSLDALIDLALTQGLAFSQADLRHAFRHDWALRALRSKRAPAARAARRSDHPLPGSL